ncbi:MAG: ketoacyl-ACP synthase III [Acidobacteria bacterium]|nr:ketoacyl-ACP synthase III [Acidobacteriota bacterium]
MTYAALTGWGKCLPPAILSNDDLSTFLDTTDEWISTRTGMKARRISHVGSIELATVASARALACAGLDPGEVDLIVYGSCSGEEQIPNSASGVQVALGARRAGAMDVNTACTSFLYGLTSAAGMIRSGTIRNALVVGVEVISLGMDWSNRNVAVLFGDGAAAVVLQASDQEEGLLGSVLGCDAEARGILRVRGLGCGWAHRGIPLGDTLWDFDGQEIFKRAVKAMSAASVEVLARCGVAPEQVDLVVPHQANLRIIEAVAKYARVPMEKVFLTVQKYGNMSAATVPVALVEAVESGRIQAGSLVLMPAFGGGLTWCAHLLRWGSRVAPLAASGRELPPCDRTALELVNAIRGDQDPHGRSREGLAPWAYAETRGTAVPAEP